MFRPAGFSDSDGDSENDGFEVMGRHGGSGPQGGRTPPRRMETRSGPPAQSCPKKASPPSTWLPLSQVHSQSPHLGQQLDLRLAVQSGDLLGVQTCLASGLDVNCHLDTVGGPTPAMLAASLAKPKVLGLLLELGGRCSYSDSGQVSTGLLALSASGVVEEEEVLQCADLLVEAGEQVDCVGRQGLSPLMLAARGGTGGVGLMKWLVDKGAKVDRRDWQGWTGLMFSVDSGHGDLTRVLLELGADPGLISKDGQRAADIAAAQGATVLQEVVEGFSEGRQEGGSVPAVGEVGGIKKMTELENVLLGLGLQEYLGVFQKQKVGLEEFLLLREEDMTSMGVREVGAVKRLLKGQAEIHRQDWEKSSLPPLLGQEMRRQGLMISCPDTTCMVANIRQHAKFMKANLGYIRLQLRDHGARLLEVGGDLVTPAQCYQQTEACCSQLELLLREAVSLRRELARHPASGQQAREWGWWALVAGCSSVAVAAVYRLRN